MPTLNTLAILAAAVANFIIGGLWFSPLLFQKPWQAVTGQTCTDVRQAMPKALPVDALAALFKALALAILIHDIAPQTLWQGLLIGLVAFIGFVAPMNLSAVLWERRPLRMVPILNGLQIVTILADCAILTLWR